MVHPEGINTPLIQDQTGSPMVNLVTFSDIEQVLALLKPSKPASLNFFGSKGSKCRSAIEGSLPLRHLFVNECIQDDANVGTLLGNAFACGLCSLKGFEGTRESTGFKAFSNFRAVYARPNSSFLDLDVRYLPSDPQARVKQLSRLMGLQLHIGDVWCCLWVFATLVLLSLAVFLLYKFDVKVVTFPKL